MRKLIKKNWPGFRKLHLDCYFLQKRGAWNTGPKNAWPMLICLCMWMKECVDKTKQVYQESKGKYACAQMGI